MLALSVPVGDKDREECRRSFFTKRQGPLNRSGCLENGGTNTRPVSDLPPLRVKDQLSCALLLFPTESHTSLPSVMYNPTYGKANFLVKGRYWEPPEWAKEENQSKTEAERRRGRREERRREGQGGMGEWGMGASVGGTGPCSVFSFLISSVCIFAFPCQFTFGWVTNKPTNSLNRH